jgi:hypothetical protein
MKRLPLLLWLLAWSCWLWLGFGLSRNLPRNLAPKIVQIPVPEGERLLGFLDDRNDVVVGSPSLPGEVHRFDIFDATTGRLKERVESADLYSRASQSSFWLSQRRVEVRKNDPLSLAEKYLKDDWRTIVMVERGTGAVFKRFWWTDFMKLEFESADGTLVAGNQGAIYHAPPVNWPILALCQTILALPLIMLWAVLRWRRQRRLLATTAI